MNFCAYGRISIYFCSFGSSSYGHVTSWPMQPQHPLGASPVVQLVMNLPAMRRPGFDSWVRKMPWRRKWQLTPAFLLGESLGQRSLAGHSPWGCNSWTLFRFVIAFLPRSKCLLISWLQSPSAMILEPKKRFKLSFISLVN